MNFNTGILSITDHKGRYMGMQNIASQFLTGRCIDISTQGPDDNPSAIVIIVYDEKDKRKDLADVSFSAIKGDYERWSTPDMFCMLLKDAEANFEWDKSHGKGTCYYIRTNHLSTSEVTCEEFYEETTDFSLSAIKEKLSQGEKFIVSKGILREYRGDEKNLVIPDDVTTISDFAFYYIKEIESLTVHRDITTIDFGKVKINKLCYQGDIESWCKIDFQGNPTINELYFNGVLQKDMVIPDTVEEIKDNAFHGCIGITSVKISEKVTKIGAGAFAKSGIESISLPEGVTAISDKVFYFCSGLKDVVLPKGIKSIGEKAFGVCENLERVVLPDKITDIGSDAFYNCTNLKELKLPAGVKTIGGSAFSGCDSLENIRIPESVTKIDKYLWGARSIERIVLHGEKSGVSDWIEVRYRGRIKNIVFGDKVDCISESAFRGCDMLESVTIKGAVELCDFSFADCTKLKTVTFYQKPFRNKRNKGGFGFSTVFAGCYNLSDIIFVNEDAHELKELLLSRKDTKADKYKQMLLWEREDEEERIRYGEAPPDLPEFKINFGIIEDYYGNTDKVIIPEGTKEISQYVFSGKGMTSVEFPDSFECIGARAFAGCSNLEKIVFGKNIRIIGEEAFLNCKKLNTVVVPDKTIRIFDDAFEGCPNVKIIK